MPLQLATLGKALGGYGAAVVGDADLIGHLAETARTYIYTTALPPAQAAATLAAVKLARTEHWRRDKLDELIGRFRERAQRAGLDLLDSQTPIQPVLCGDDGRALAMAQSLEQAGYWVARDPPADRAGRPRAPARHPVGAARHRRCRRPGRSHRQGPRPRRPWPDRRADARSTPWFDER